MLIPWAIPLSSKKGEWLTPHEAKTIRESAKCPDCGGQLLRGPQGGGSENTCCEICQSEFCIDGWTGHGTRLSDHGPRDAGERKCLYGLH
jgi:hypothetical protein